MKRSVSVLCVCSAPNCCDKEQRSASQPGSVESGTSYILHNIKEGKLSGLVTSGVETAF
jgi:hypothetical protein